MTVPEFCYQYKSVQCSCKHLVSPGLLSCQSHLFTEEEEEEAPYDPNALPPGVSEEDVERFKKAQDSAANVSVGVWVI